MKLIYIANIRIPTEKAHGVQIMETCSSFSNQLRFDVELIVPSRFNNTNEDPFVYYGIKSNFSIKKLPCIDLVRFGKFGFLTELFSFSFFVAIFSLFKKNSLFYTRDELIALLLHLMGKKITWEDHRGDKNIITTILLKLNIKIVVISNGLKNFYLERGVSPERIFVAPDAADVEKFDISLSKEDARKQLNLPLDKKIVLYMGHLYSWKGADVLAKSALHIEDKNTIYVFIGGTEQDLKKFRKEFAGIENVYILGNKPLKETPIYQKAADVLIVPNSAKSNLSKLYTSPMKLFSYMAGDRPIVASDLPSLREILNENNSVLVESDNPKSLADGIRKVLNNNSLADKISRQALMDVQNYTWKKRAKNILSFIWK